MSDLPALAMPSLAQATTGPTNRLSKPFTVTVVLLLLGSHALLGLAARAAPVIATVHGLMVGTVLLIMALASSRMDRIVALTVYASLCDVFWRMTYSKVPWEFSKYLLIVGALSVLLRFTRPWSRSLVPLGFLACLGPGLLLMIISNGVMASKSIVADYALGCIALCIAVLAFRQLVLAEAEAWNLGWIMLAPIMSALAITLHASSRLGADAFTDESSHAATGGFGPNQVSTALGLGILLCVLLGFQRRGPQYLTILGGVGLLLAWATFVTFSRGGIYSVAVAAVVMLLVGIRSRGQRARSVVILIVGVTGLLMMYSSVNDFSGNSLEQRYSGGASADATTGRSNLALQDLDTFTKHPIWGVGVGASSQYHHLDGHVTSATHTEQTRLLADHGIFGLVAIGLLFAMLIGAYRSALSQWNRFFVVATFAWGFTTMLHAATRLAAVSLLIALSQLRIESDQAPLHE